MSDYCSGCRYEVKEKAGPLACPFNYLYWDFLDRHREKLKENPRLGHVYRSLERMGADRRREIGRDARRFLAALNGPEQS
jgi:deoxyribodipyrimidine photolyase-related protein